jgi:hypothetical protein
VKYYLFVDDPRIQATRKLQSFICGYRAEVGHTTTRINMTRSDIKLCISLGDIHSTLDVFRNVVGAGNIKPVGREESVRCF